MISLYALMVADSFSLRFHLIDISPVHVFLHQLHQLLTTTAAFPAFAKRIQITWQLPEVTLLTPALHRSNTGANGAHLFTLGKDLTLGAEHSVVASTNSPR